MSSSPSFATDTVLLLRLGQAVARVRLDRNLTQEDLAREAGVSRATVHRLEGGQSTQLTNLLRVLRALGIDPDLSRLLPSPEVRPLEELRRGERHEPRRRARPPRGPAGGDDAPWTWGDEA